MVTVEKTGRKRSSDPIFRPYPGLGNMLSEAQGYMPRNPWLAMYPGIIIFLTVLAIKFLGDALDPLSRR